jgi:hypothetical protein
MVEMDYGELAPGRQLESSATMVVVTSDVASALERLRWWRCEQGILRQALNQHEVLWWVGSMVAASYEAVSRLGQNPHEEVAIYRGKSHVLMAQADSGRIQTKTD